MSRLEDANENEEIEPRKSVNPRVGREVRHLYQVSLISVVSPVPRLAIRQACSAGPSDLFFSREQPKFVTWQRLVRILDKVGLNEKVGSGELVILQGQLVKAIDGVEPILTDPGICYKIRSEFYTVGDER